MRRKRCSQSEKIRGGGEEGEDEKMRRRRKKGGREREKGWVVETLMPLKKGFGRKRR